MDERGCFFTDICAGVMAVLLTEDEVEEEGSLGQERSEEAARGGGCTRAAHAPDAECGQPSKAVKDGANDRRTPLGHEICGRSAKGNTVYQLQTFSDGTTQTLLT